MPSANNADAHDADWALIFATTSATPRAFALPGVAIESSSGCAIDSALSTQLNFFVGTCAIGAVALGAVCLLVVEMRTCAVGSETTECDVAAFALTERICDSATEVGVAHAALLPAPAVTMNTAVVADRNMRPRDGNAEDSTGAPLRPLVCENASPIRNACPGSLGHFSQANNRHLRKRRPQGLLRPTREGDVGISIRNTHDLKIKSFL